MGDEDQPVALVSWPFENLSKSDSTSFKEVLVKEDGSLMSSVMLPSGKLILKSKDSFVSKEAEAANQLLGTAPCKPLYQWTKDVASRGYTVTLEYTPPFNKNKAPYSQAKLTIWAVRNHADGSYVDLLNSDHPSEIKKLVVKNVTDQVENTQTGQRNKAKTICYSPFLQVGNPPETSTEYGTLLFGSKPGPMANPDKDDGLHFGPGEGPSEKTTMGGLPSHREEREDFGIHDDYSEIDRVIDVMSEIDYCGKAAANFCAENISEDDFNSLVADVASQEDEDLSDHGTVSIAI
ncbi:MAG: hypothetical protein SGILL_006859 [Bacillariaceae sp.]